MQPHLNQHASIITSKSIRYGEDKARRAELHCIIRMTTKRDSTKGGGQAVHPVIEACNHRGEKVIPLCPGKAEAP